MNNLNTVLIEGTLTRDPESRPLSAGVNYCRLAIANNRYYCDANGEWKQETSYFHIYVYGAVAEACIKRLRKGRGIRVTGRLKQNTWTDAGVRREVVFIIAEHIEFQPERRSVMREEVPEPGRIPGELNTTANMDGLEPPKEEGLDADVDVVVDTADVDDSQQEMENSPEF